MKTEKELREELIDLEKLDGLRDNGVINLSTVQKNKITRKIEFLKEILA